MSPDLSSARPSASSQFMAVAAGLQRHPLAPRCDRHGRRDTRARRGAYRDAPGRRKVAASLAGRDPSTDVAALRIEAQSLPIAVTADAGSLRPGHLIFAVGSFEGAPAASLGLVGFVGSAWQSLRGGTIDSLLRLDLALSPRAEGGAVVNSRARVVGMAVSGPRRRVLVHPDGDDRPGRRPAPGQGICRPGIFRRRTPTVRLARDATRRSRRNASMRS